MALSVNKVDNFYNSRFELKPAENTPSLTMEPDRFVKELTTPKNIGIALGAIGAISIVLAGAMLCIKKGVTQPARRLAKHIDFVKANTMEEAAAFAKNKLGIEKLELENDLELANWVNEGLVNINNLFKGTAHMPKKVFFDKHFFKGKNQTGAAAVYRNQTIGLNKDVFNKNKLIEDNVDYFKTIISLKSKFKSDIDPVLWKNFQKYSKHPREYTRFDALTTKQLFEDFLCITAHKRGGGAMEYLKKVYKKAYGTDIKIEQNSKYSIPTRRSPFHYLYHEMGHLLNDMNSSVKDDIFLLHLSGKRSFINNAEKQRIAGKVSTYSQTAPFEFVADTFALMCDGRKLPDDVMKLYKQYNGPIPPGLNC